MEAKFRINRSRLGKLLILAFFGLFMTARSEAALLAPNVTVSPSATNVSNGDTVTIDVSAYVLVGVLNSISCQYNGGPLPANASFTTSGDILALGASVNATLTITNMSPATAGTYTISASTVGLLNLLTTTVPVTVNLNPSVVGISSGSAMIEKGFKLQFSGPTGSNLVIQASSDLTHWTSIYTNRIVGGSLTYTDAVARTVSGRFYRAKLK